MSVTIYHNPKCGNSRGALALIQEAGITPTVIEYLKDTPSKAKLKELIAAIGKGARHVLRDKEPLCKELGLDDPKVSDARLIEAMLEHPILINRPIVVTKKGVRLCRPPETVKEIL